MSSPTNHWAVVKQILCYLKCAPRHEILYKDLNHTSLECFLDVDWVGSLEDMRSTFEYCVFVG